MPIYEYKCDKCEEVFEVRQKFSDEPLTTHEQCGGSVHRLLSAPAFQFKGSGWYITDYARAGSSKKDSVAGESKSDSKPASESGKSTTSESTSSESTSSPSKTSTSETSKPKSETKTGASKK